MNYDYILAIDPSGSFYEGKGTTGWCIFNAKDNVVSITGIIKASKFDAMASYWDAHINLINRFYEKYKSMVVVIEDYILYADRASSQINSHMETSKLIGLLQHHCWSRNIPYHMQLAAEVKKRWADSILHHKQYIKQHGRVFCLPDKPNQRLYPHNKDAIRHAVHYATFRNGGTNNEFRRNS